MEDITNWNVFLIPYQQTVDELCAKFNNIDREYKLLGQHSPIEYVEGRVKRVSSILEKASRKNIPFDDIPEKIEDIAGVRIICRFVEDIEKIVEMIRKREDFDIRITQERDYIQNTKSSGYRSYHVLIKYKLFTIEGVKEISGEIQIRTLAMNFWATIEHSLKYKYSGKMPDELQRRLKNSAEAAFILDKEMSTIRDELLAAQKIVKVKADLIESILDKIQALHFVARIEKVNELNRQFMMLFDEDDLDKLSEFNDRLDVLAQVYNIQN